MFESSGIATIVRKQCWLIIIALISCPVLLSQTNITEVPPCEASANVSVSISLVSPPQLATVATFVESVAARGSGHLYLRNDGNLSLSRLCLRAYLTDFEGKSVIPQVGIQGSQLEDGSTCYLLTKPIQPGATYDLLYSLKVPQKRLPLTGLLAVGAFAEAEIKKPPAENPKGSKTPTIEKCTAIAKEVAQNIALTIADSQRNATRVVAYSGLIGVLFFLISLGYFWAKRKMAMGPSLWSFSGSIATNLTVFGTLLSSALVSTVFPDYPHYMTKQSYFVLSLFFGVLASLSPILYNFFCKPDGLSSVDPNQLNFQGNITLFLLADSMTIWAVCGQLACLSLLFSEFAARGFVPVESTYVTWGIAGLVATSLAFMCFRVAGYYASQQPRPVLRVKLDEITKDVGPENVSPPPWNIP